MSPYLVVATLQDTPGVEQEVVGALVRKQRKGRAALSGYVAKLRNSKDTSLLISLVAIQRTHTGGAKQTVE